MNLGLNIEELGHEHRILGLGEVDIGLGTHILGLSIKEPSIDTRVSSLIALDLGPTLIDPTFIPKAVAKHSGMSVGVLPNRIVFDLNIDI